MKYLLVAVATLLGELLSKFRIGLGGPIYYVKSFIFFLRLFRDIKIHRGPDHR